MLRQVYNISWREKVTNKELFGNTEKLSSIICRNRLKLAGHTFRDKTSPAHQLVTWIPKHGTTRRGRPTGTYVDTLLRETGLNDELEKCMEDRDVWRLFSSRRLHGAVCLCQFWLIFHVNIAVNWLILDHFWMISGHFM